MPKDDHKSNSGKAKKDGKAKAKPEPPSSGAAIAKIFDLINDLKLDDKIFVAKAAAGLAGMVALFPSQIPKRKKSEPSGGTDGSGSGKGKGKAEAQPRNPLKDSDQYKRFVEARKELQRAKEENGGKDLPEDHPAVLKYKQALDDWNSFRKEHAEVSEKKASKDADAQKASFEEAADKRKTRLRSALQEQ